MTKPITWPTSLIAKPAPDSRDFVLRKIEREGLEIPQVDYAFAEPSEQEGYDLHLVVSDRCSAEDRVRIEKSAAQTITNAKVNVVQRARFNNALRAMLRMNFGLLREIERIRMVDPDIDKALRALDAIIADPDPGPGMPILTGELP